MYGRDSNDFAVTTADDVDVTYTDLYTSGENAMDFDSIYNSPQSPDRIVAADEIALADDDDVKNQQRLMHIASFGPIRIVKPTPSFVMKTKRHSGTKIFVNVCTHDFVPFKVMDSGAMNSNNVFTYMVVSAPLEHTNEKDSSYCVVYDVVVNAKVVSVSSSDESGRARAVVSISTHTLSHSIYNMFLYSYSSSSSNSSSSSSSSSSKNNNNSSSSSDCSGSGSSSSSNSSSSCCN